LVNESKLGLETNEIYMAICEVQNQLILNNRDKYVCALCRLRQGSSYPCRTIGQLLFGQRGIVLSWRIWVIDDAVWCEARRACP
jgi:hypothetical protein